MDEGEGGRSIVFLLSNSDLITLEIGRAVGDTVGTDIVGSIVGADPLAGILSFYQPHI